MKAASLLLVLALPVSAMADVVDLKWTGGAFAHKTSIAPKKFLEVCGKLKMGDGVGWQFKATAPTDFNIHYHVGKDVSYPVNRKDVALDEGMFLVPVDQDYCWMWSNGSAQPIDIQVELRQAN